jgi:DNA repair protein RadC
MTLPTSNEGHRGRLRERFIESGLEGFADYEIIELLLTLGSPRRDCKPSAKAAMERFGSFRGVLEAKQKELEEIPGIGPHNAFGIKFVQEVGRKFLKETLKGTVIRVSSSKELFDYLYHSMRDLNKEVFKVVYLDSQNQVIDTNELFHGTVNSSPVHIREVMESALGHSAVSLIFAHNHPTGNPEPSKADYDITRDLVQAGVIMQIKVLDHLIVGNNQYFSMATDGFIERCELDFLKFSHSPKGH